MPGKGRPRKLTDAQRRSKFLVIRLTDSELQAIKAKAARLGMEPSRMVRILAVRKSEE
jgi:hypothetical protein